MSKVAAFSVSAKMQYVLQGTWLLLLEEYNHRKSAAFAACPGVQTISDELNMDGID